MKQYSQTIGAIILGSDFKALGVARSLGKAGVPCAVIDDQKRSAWFSRYVMKRFSWKGTMQGQDFLHFLLSVAKNNHLEQWILFPVHDEALEFIARNSQSLSPIFQMARQEWETVQWICDKRRTYQLVQEIGLNYPKTWYPAGEDELADLPCPFPVIVKPAFSIQFHHITRLKALLANNYEELLAHYQFAASIISADEIMIQEMIPGNGNSQFSAAAYCKDGACLLMMTARRTRQYPVDFGLSSSFVEAIDVPSLHEPAQKLLSALGVTGMVEVEFKYDSRDDQYKLLDVNLRPWGWHTLCIACGLDFPYIQYCDILGQTPQTKQPLYGYRWMRLLTDVLASSQEIRSGMISRQDYLQSFGRHLVFSTLDWQDPLPIIADICSVTSLWLGGHYRTGRHIYKRWERKNHA
jgi:D-aspartate ligase